MKKIGVFCLVFFCILNFCSFRPCAAQVDQNSLPSLSIGSCSGLDADTALLGSDKLIENAEAAFLYDIGSGTLMYAWNADVQMAPSSLVKIMTALIAIEKGNMDDIVTVKESVLASVPLGAVSAELLPDEQLPLMDLLYCMMVGSANDAAAVIADHIAGSQEAFLLDMNERAASLGCTGTQFVNVHGLHNDQQYTTARDIARILAEAMKHDLFRTVFSAVSYTVAATNKSEVRELITGNFLMSTDDIQIYYDGRVTGGRTGVANDGTRCLAASAEGNGLQLISVLMGAESVINDDGYTVSSFGSFKETTALLDKGFEGYKAVQVLFAGQALQQSSVINGSNDVILGSVSDVTAVLPANVSLSDLSFNYQYEQELKAPIEQGQNLSYVEIWYGNLCVAKADLIAMNAVQSIASLNDPTLNNASDDSFSAVLRVIVWIIVIIAALILLVLLIRRIRRILNKRRGRKYRQSRRRSR